MGAFGRYPFVHPGFALLAALALAGCGGEGTGKISSGADPDVTQPPDTPTPDGPDAGSGPGPEPAAPSFQPAFHQALRFSQAVGGPATLRFPVPLARTGGRIKIAFRAGGGPLHIVAATAGRPGQDGALAQTPVTLTFGGKTDGRAEAGQLLESDPVDFSVSAIHEEVVISFDAEGALATSSISLFRGGLAAPGGQAAALELQGSQPLYQMHGIATVYVEATPARAYIALGDSITEGYIEGSVDRPDDYHDTWPFVAEGIVGLPIVNAAVSGQGIYESWNHLAGEVLNVTGITDCIVMLGSNDLGSGGESIIKNYERLLVELRPFCHVYATTIPPKDRRDNWSDRAIVNNWLRAQGAAGALDLIDLDTAVGAPPTYEGWLTGMSIDGIHPSVGGNAAIARRVAQVLAPR